MENTKFLFDELDTDGGVVSDEASEEKGEETEEEEEGPDTATPVEE